LGIEVAMLDVGKGVEVFVDVLGRG